MAETARGLTKAEIDDLLRRPIVSRLATVQPDGSPYVVPIWHYWDGEALWIIPRGRSAFVEHIRQEPRVFFSCAVDGDGNERVSIAGTAEIVEGPAKLAGRMMEIASEMGSRYVGPPGLEYIDRTANRPRYLVRIDPVKITSWKGGEWHPRYLSERASDRP